MKKMFKKVKENGNLLALCTVFPNKSIAYWILIVFLKCFASILNLFNVYIFVILEVQSKRYSCATRVQKWSLGYKKEGTMLSFRGTIKKVHLCHLGVQIWYLRYKRKGTMLSHKVHICSLEVQTKKVQRCTTF